jgi:hypothetical protein
MQTTIDEITGKRIQEPFYYVLIRKAPNGTFIYGYTKEIEQCAYVACRVDGENASNFNFPPSNRNGMYRLVPVIYENFKDKIFFSNKRGQYMMKDDMSEDQQVLEFLTKYTRGGDPNAAFPYHFQRRYEAIESFRLFKDKQKIIEAENFKLSKYMKYTFGLEYETSAGMIPENICYRDGLIPLRDGSISGFEYSTVVMDPTTGPSLLKQQLKTLKDYTIFNKECSLHIHFGGYPLDPKKIYALYKMCYCLQPEIASLVPELTFNSSAYKSSGKDYCKSLPKMSSFNDLYYKFVGRNFMGSLEQPHPNDLTRTRKWNISTRYYYVNFINILCYKVNKTIEFRLLRPTYNFSKIKVWLYIFNAILKFSEENYEDIISGHLDGMGLYGIMSRVYPSDISDKLQLEMKKLQLVCELQSFNGDRIGSDTSIEDKVFIEE